MTQAWMECLTENEEAVRLLQRERTQLLDGTANMTLSTLSDILFVLNRSLVVQEAPLAKTVGDECLSITGTTSQHSVV